ncbi:hypothetical protein HER32_02270 [Hymenobacter sp. BT18]|uniref:hypothetical protein n=1 Tax=Hymenobacter sp. BT18 TaxID=2835648 RepID=UPI00143ECB6A|nr:hypothetical protein [Hymenobacter sp. BT18]QIX60075.1 hypothetical protein HER32_02270 [Hymenobacter sp. BT18]
MPKRILPFALLGLLACQQQPASTPAAATASATTETVQTAPAAPSAVSNSATSGLSINELKFLKEYNVASLIAKEPDDHEIMNGFYGPDHYRIEFAMLKVRQDSVNPAHYFVQGKNRYKKVVTPFSGEIMLTQLTNQPKMTVPKGEKGKGWRKYVDEQNQLNAYVALGKFTFTEAAGHKGAGTFSGDVIVEFLVSEEGELSAFCRNRQFNSRGGEILFDGKWTNPDTQQQKAVVWVSNIMSFRQDVFAEFTIGERDPDFNPKYAKLGWDTYWQNDEWWAEPGALKAEDSAEAGVQATELASTDSL